VRGVGIEDVVTPIGVEDRAVAFAILPIRGFPVGGFQDAKEVGKKIDQHARGYENAGRDARERLVNSPLT
jgi:hypothetical protein